jgi:hypothetical protein
MKDYWKTLEEEMNKAFVEIYDEGLFDLLTKKYIQILWKAMFMKWVMMENGCKDKSLYWIHILKILLFVILVLYAWYATKW